MGRMISLLGGDARSAILARLLEQDGYAVSTWGLASFEAPGAAPLEAAVRADTVVLPLPLTKDGATLYGTEGTQTLAALWRLFSPEQRLYAGGVSASIAADAARCGLTLRDYLDREELAVRNAVPTAEGAIQLAMERLPVTLHGTECLIFGFGRIGKLLALRLQALHARVTVAARRPSDLAWAEAFGCRAVPLAEKDRALSEARVVFNTVPQLLLGEAELEKTRRDCLLIELASLAGIDAAAAQRTQRTLIAAGGLPGRVAPETAARAIRDTLYRMWEEEA